MAVYEATDLISLECAAAVPFARFVQMNAAGGRLNVKQADDQSEGLMGVSAEAITLEAGQTGCLGVVISGVAKVRSAGTIAIGASVSTENDGQALTAAEGTRRMGVALSAAVDGDIFPILLTQGQILA